MSMNGQQRQGAKSQQQKVQRTQLRRRAEHHVSPVTRTSTTLAQEDVEGLLYELQVHQIELEMQYRQLQESQCETEESRNNYRELYESLPIGYATVDASGKICDLNPAGSSLLGLMTDHRLPNFHVFVATKDVDRFDLLCRTVLAKHRGRTAELTLERADGAQLTTEVVIHPVKAAAGPPRLRLTFQDVSGRKRAEETVRAQQAQLEWDRREVQFLTTRLLCARGEERRRIAGALRDHCQRLATCLGEIGSIMQTLGGQEREQMKLIDVRLQELLREFHHFTDELQGAALEERSFSQSMRRYLEEVSVSAKLPIEFREVHVPCGLPNPVEQCLYRLLQESLDNIVNHAGAQQVVVTLTGFSRGIEMRVIDDGRGFDLTEVLRTKKGMGLMSIQERVRRLEGKVVIQSRPGQGAELKIVIPTTGIVSEESAKPS